MLEVKKYLLLVVVALLNGCISINTVEELRATSRLSPVYHADESLEDLEDSIQAYMTICNKPDYNPVRINGTVVGGALLSVDRIEVENGVDYVAKQAVQDGYFHYLLVSLRGGNRPNKSTAQVFADDHVGEDVFKEVKKITKGMYWEC
ncbi:hypothetical protein [Pseudoalteromonas ardens]|uniref:Uncharacterized protein n=1 Tax=Pseudoalteromonas rubra TaxID=43658 RepID=A0A0L0ENN6_9GAMM|nr:hypothetical protein [Pseudoalteromonas sp. R96]KNC66029.1 hypothetical protein AC626_19485 [Pseudoalteromonas rubra]MDK1311009.1 hypothetical protein [Pseudoalteromonas sp. R96]